MKVTWLTCRQEVRCMHSRLESGIQDFISMISREQKWYSMALKFDPKRPCYICFGHWNTWSWSPELAHEKNRLPRGHRAMRCPGYVKKPCAGFLTNDPQFSQGFGIMSAQALDMWMKKSPKGPIPYPLKPSLLQFFDLCGAEANIPNFPCLNSGPRESGSGEDNQTVVARTVTISVGLKFGICIILLFVHLQMENLNIFSSKNPYI